MSKKWTLAVKVLTHRHGFLHSLLNVQYVVQCLTESVTPIYCCLIHLKYTNFKKLLMKVTCMKIKNFLCLKATVNKMRGNKNALVVTVPLMTDLQGPGGLH